MKRWAASGALVAVLVGSPRLASAQVRDLRWDPALDVSVTAGGAALWLASEALKGDLAPSRCHWCRVDPADAAVREALVWADPGPRISSATPPRSSCCLSPPWGSTPSPRRTTEPAATSPRMRCSWPRRASSRQTRTSSPRCSSDASDQFVHALPPDQKPSTGSPSDNNLSFFSGHSSETFALAVASGTVASMHRYRWAPIVWGVGGVLAATTAYLRIAADRHWLTDVLVGAVVGAGIGFTLPYVFHSAKGDSPTATTGAGLRAPAAPLPLMTLAW